MTKWWLAALVALAVPAAAHQGTAGGWPAEWYRPAEPVRVAGNVWYVGTEGLSAFLVTGPAGHVLIDGGLPESAPLIAANIEKLGFRLADVKLLLINHAHFDHAGGLAELKRRTGAKLLASAKDAPDLAAGRALIRPEQPAVPPVSVDRIVRDGETVTLGPIRLTAHLTPGHTPGATSWSTTVRHNGQPLRILFASSLTVAGLKLRDNPAYPDAIADFRGSFVKLRQLRADVFLTFHPDRFGFADKAVRAAAGDARAFIDPGELARRLDIAEREFEADLRGSSVH
jgi:metallo-beta-lactamase class B